MTRRVAHLYRAFQSTCGCGHPTSARTEAGVYEAIQDHSAWEYEKRRLEDAPGSTIGDGVDPQHPLKSP